MQQDNPNIAFWESLDKLAFEATRDNGRGEMQQSLSKVATNNLGNLCQQCHSKSKTYYDSIAIMMLTRTLIRRSEAYQSVEAHFHFFILVFLPKILSGFRYSDQRESIGFLGQQIFLIINLSCMEYIILAIQNSYKKTVASLSEHANQNASATLSRHAIKNALSITITIHSRPRSTSTARQPPSL